MSPFLIWLTGFRAWIEDDGNVGLKVPRWYLLLDPHAKKLAARIDRDVREHPEDWR